MPHGVSFMTTTIDERNENLMKELERLFGERELTQTAHTVLRMAERSREGAPCEAGHVLLAVIGLNDDYAAAQRLHQLGFTPDTRNDFTRFYADVMGDSLRVQARQSLEQMAQKATTLANDRSSRRSLIFVSDLAVAALLSQSWMVERILSISRVSLDDALVGLGTSRDRLLRL